MTISEPAALGTILGVWAHPDDETYLSGGLMAAAVRAGHRVACVTATRGEGGSLDEKRWPSETLAEVREQELAEALGLLGVLEHRWLGYADGACARVPQEEAVALVGGFIEEFEPDSVLTFGPEGMTGHPDHKAVHVWTTLALEQASTGADLYCATNTPEWAAEVLPLAAGLDIFFEPDTPPITPRRQLSFEYVLPPEILDLKWQALLAQRSQTERLIEAMGAGVLRSFNATEPFVRFPVGEARTQRP
ncbi:MAG: PIG-L family deacetylase [Actinomycetota bacterium]|nr:PIG-L family deacetylase [Actinomycetota bacterium]